MKHKKRIGLDIPRDVIPVRTANWEEEDDLIQIKMQKFEGRLGKWLCKVLHKPNYALVHLDKLGSFIWRQCTGDATIDDILMALDKDMGNQFDAEEELEKRTYYFFHMLRNHGLLTWGRVSRDSNN